MIGGGEIANLFLKEGLIDEFILTKIKKVHDGDTFFPFHFLEKWPFFLVRKHQDFDIYRYFNPKLKN